MKFGLIVNGLTTFFLDSHKTENCPYMREGEGLFLIRDTQIEKKC